MCNKKRIRKLISKKYKNHIREVKFFNHFIYGWKFKIPQEYLKELKKQSPEDFKRQYLSYPVEEI